MGSEKQLVNVSAATLADCNLELLRSQEFCDVIFIVGSSKDRFPCHQLLLMSRSAVFQSLFSPNWKFGGGWKKSNCQEVQLPNINPGVFRLFLEFIYGDLCPTNFMDAVKVLPVAHKYEVLPLIQKCQQVLMQIEMKIESVIPVYEVARSCGLNSLKKKAGDFMADEFHKLIKEPAFESMEEEILLEFLVRDDLVVDEVKLFEAVIRWSDARSKNLVMDVCPDKKRQHILNKILPLIRFPLMETESFCNSIVPTNLLTPEEVGVLLNYFNSGISTRNCMSQSIGFSCKPRLSKDLNDNSYWMTPTSTPKPRCPTSPLPPLVGWNIEL